MGIKNQKKDNEEIKKQGDIVHFRNADSSFKLRLKKTIMLNLIEHNGVRRPGERWNRRDVLRIGTLGLTGLTLADLLRARADGAEQSTPTKKTSVILLFLEGGASQFETFDLTQEEPRLRERYGPGLGQELLLARRLCEAGVGFVTINNSTNGDIDGWDHHKTIIPSCQFLSPPVDQAVSAFIADVRERGLDEEILLIITGEFGRTPHMNKNAGRDHWAPINPLILAGGGLKMGQTIGASDSHGAYPQERPILPEDLMATCFHFLGIKQDLQYVHLSGRPISMIHGDGRPIKELP